MRVSCNGCRVLRKGCSDNCIIRPCLQWMTSSDSQANATLFLAKFYGRAGLLNLIEAGPDHMRPAIFKSLLYEACGRIVNPVYGSVGLLWAGNWAQCEAAFEAVLNGSSIVIPPIPNASSASSSSGVSALPQIVPPFKTCDIRHVAKDHPANLMTTACDVNKAKTRAKFKRSNGKHKLAGGELSHESKPNLYGSCKEDQQSLFSVDSVAVGSLMSRVKPDPVVKFRNDGEGREVGLELTLGWDPMPRPRENSGEGSNSGVIVE